MDDAVRYMLLVKELLHPKDWKIFLEILKEFKAQKSGYAGVVQRVSALFMGHPRRPELARGFNIFLPRGYKYRVEFSSPGEVVVIDDLGRRRRRRRRRDAGDPDGGGARRGRPGARRAARRRRFFRISLL